MFSKYKKPGDVAAATPAPKAKAPAPQQQPEAAVAPKPVSMRRVAQAASVAPQDRDVKRKQRMSEIKLELHRALLENLNLAALEHASEQDLRSEINEISAEILAEKSIVLNREDRIQLNSELYDEVTGLGPLETLLKDDTINDILVNGPQQIFVERDGKLQLTDVTFKDEKHLLRIIDKIVSAVGRRVDESNPYVDARLKDGSRFNAMVPPIAVDGSLVSIRKFKKDKLGIDDLVSFGAFSEEMAAYLQAAVATRLNIIVSGGTGSGKTTTLYAALAELDSTAINVLTVEDPIEYSLPGIGQTQVNNKADMTFARGLRAILRQDPDGVMVGEIRDLETAEIAVQSSLTGHMVMSTLHTNSAIGAVTRLMDMGVEPFLLSSSIIGVLAQRLVRVLCPDCRVARSATPVELSFLSEKEAQVFTAPGCAACSQSGFRGRTGIYEMVTIDETLRQHIHDGRSEHEMVAYARTKAPSIRQDGVQKVLLGITTVEEVLRVSLDD